MSTLTSVEVPWIGEDLKCPVCGFRIDIKIRVLVNNIHVRNSGSHGMTPVISTSVDSEADGAIINHICSKKEDR